MSIFKKANTAVLQEVIRCCYKEVEAMSKAYYFMREKYRQLHKSVMSYHTAIKNVLIHANTIDEPWKHYAK